MSVLLIDNYDSFTYNLYQYLSELGAEVTVVRNDAVTVEQVEAMAPERIVISPGPCTPKEAGISVEVVRRFAGRVPVLGVCLGHQCIGEAFGGVVDGAGEIRHGKLSTVTHDGRGLFAGLPDSFQAIRYHSLAVQPETMPAELEVTAHSDSGVIMGVRHKRYAVEGIQFHPESIMTEHGKEILATFLAMREEGSGTGTPPPTPPPLRGRGEPDMPLLPAQPVSSRIDATVEVEGTPRRGSPLPRSGGGVGGGGHPSC